MLGKKIARLQSTNQSSWCVGEEDSKAASSWCWERRQRVASSWCCRVGEEDKGQGFQFSNLQVIINKGIPPFCYIVVFNEAYEYIYTLCI